MLYRDPLIPLPNTRCFLQISKLRITCLWPATSFSEGAYRLYSIKINLLLLRRNKRQERVVNKAGKVLAVHFKYFTFNKIVLPKII